MGDVGLWIGVLVGACVGGGVTWFLMSRAVTHARQAAEAADGDADRLRDQLNALAEQSASELETMANTLAQVGSQAEHTLGLRAAADESVDTGIRRTAGQEPANPSVSVASAEAATIDLKQHSRAIEHSLVELERRSELIASILENATAEDRMADHKGDDLITAANEAVHAASAIDEVIRKLQGTASDTAELSTQVSTEAERGYRAVHRTLDQIERIRELTGVARARIEALGERVSDIGHVVKVIQDITEKTNLLALNASIIAAQAGEHGRSFAVVATEIKALAQRTASSTKEISVQIRGVQEESERATAAMVDGVGAVGEGFQVAIAAGDALDAIRQTARRAQKRVQSMTRTLRQQFSAAQQVVDSAAVVSDRAASFATAVRGQSSLADQLRGGASDIQDAARQISELLREHNARSGGLTALLGRAAAQLAAITDRERDIHTRIESLRGDIGTSRDLGDSLAAHWGAVSEATAQLKSHAVQLREQIER